jgi:nucleoside 2-deoxyribosyltransferase
MCAKINQIYFSCSIVGGRQDQLAYQAIVEKLLDWGYQVPTAHLASDDVTRLETIEEPHEVFERDDAWVRECDALVAEVSTPSHGVGYEIALALELGKPVICCYQIGKKVSKMITGNTKPTFKLAPYHTPQEAIQQVQAFLEDLQNAQ